MSTMNDALSPRDMPPKSVSGTSAQEAFMSVPVPRIWGIANSRHAWIIAQDFDDYRAAVLRALGANEMNTTVVPI